MTSRIIHSGRLLDFLNESTTFRRLANLSFFCADCSVRILSRSSTASFSMLTRLRSSLIASAPICARNLGPCSSRADGRRGDQGASRSEEHTSELQSRLHLVCRLL